MNKGFPHKFLWIPIGWRDRGNIGANYLGNGVEEWLGCSLCKTRIKIGIEDGVVFKYCPKCLVKFDKHE